MLTIPLGWVSFLQLVQPLLSWTGETIQDKTYFLVIRENKADQSTGKNGMTDKTQT
jgi:hypothetical protein